MEGENGKKMEKVSHLCVFGNFSSWSGIEMSKSFPSDLVGVRGFQFRVIIYPRGKSKAAQKAGMVSVCIKNESAQQAQVVFSFEILHQYGLPYLSIRRSLFHDRGLFRRVMTVAPDEEVGIMHFVKLATIERKYYSYVKRNSIKLMATIGLFVNPAPNQQLLDQFVFFQVQDKQYYAEESVLQKHCPALCPTGVGFRNVVLANIESDTFDAVLWFIYHEKLNYRDKKDISTCDVSDPNSLGVRIVRAARRYNLDLLKEICESIIYYESLNIHNCVFPIKCCLTETWRCLHGQHGHGD